MNTLKNKRYINFGYLSRQTGVPIYYDTLGQREFFGIGSDLNKETPSFTHKVKPEDTLDSLALKYYNNPTYWWVIANFNDIQDAFIKLTDKYTILQIPNISALMFEKNKR